MDFSTLKKISWYPGHMLKAQRDIKEKLAAVDLVVELVDARAPASTRNFLLSDQVRHKATFVVLGKSDLADPEATAAWRRHWAAQGQPCSAVHYRDRRAVGRLVEQLKATARSDDRSRWGDKLRYNRRLRAIVVGLPNVGKSTLINALAGRRRAKTGPHPGVTRHQQWIDLDQGLELLDTPGIMVPAVSDPEMGLKLGLLAVIKRQIVSDELLAEYLHYQLAQQQQLGILQDAYKLPSAPGDFPELLTLVATRLGLKRTGDQLDAPRAAACLVQDFREKKLGRLSLELPPDPAGPSDQ